MANQWEGNVKGKIAVAAVSVAVTAVIVYWLSARKSWK